MPSAAYLSSFRRPGSSKGLTKTTPSTRESIPVHLTGEVPPLTRRTFISNKITFPFTVTQASLYFPQGCDHLLRVWLFISPDNDRPTASEPNGLNLLTPLAPVPFIIGDDVDLFFPLSMTHLPIGAWIKLHAQNLDGDSHYPTALVTIQEYIEEPT